MDLIVISYYSLIIYKYFWKGCQIASIIAEKTMNFLLKLAYYLGELSFLVDI